MLNQKLMKDVLLKALAAFCLVGLLSACGGKTPDKEPDDAPPAVQDPTPPQAQNLALMAETSTSMVSPWETLAAVNNGSNPGHSNDKSAGAYGNWNSPNTYQWVEYRWLGPVTVQGSEIYWFDDNGGVLAPSEAYLEYWSGNAWRRLGDIPGQKDTFNSLTFDAVETDRLRVTMRNQNQSTGILEWRVWGQLPDDYGDSDPIINPPTPSQYQPVTTQYQHRGITPDNALVRDSDHFRIYYGGEGKNGPNGELGSASTAQLDILLHHLETAYQMFVVDWGFRSPGQSVHSRVTGRYKLNLYLVSTINGGAAGVMLYNNSAGLCYLEVRSDQIRLPHVAVHEYGHCLTLAEYQWVDKAATGAWWETKAQWISDTYQTSPQHAEVAAQYGQTRYSTLFDPQKVVAQSHLSIIHRDNLYQNWPFFTYLTNNPDGYSGLGRDAVRTMIRQHQGQETPLHTLARFAGTSTQNLMARYQARLAFMDLDHSLAQQRLMEVWTNNNFRQAAYNNLQAVGTNEYRVREARRPMYGGSNIIPLQITGDGQIFISVLNLGNGLADSEFTAIVAVRAADGRVRYEALRHGIGPLTVAPGEEAILVITNTPNNLYQFNAFDSTDTTPDRRGLNYQVQIIGAQPRFM